MYAIIKFLVKIYFHIAYRLRYEGKKNLPKDTNFILASNHRSYADPPLVGVGARGKHSFMAKEELFEKQPFAWLIRSLGAFPVTRGAGDTSAIDNALDRLANKRNFMIFPEGTRSKDGKVGRGHSGAALIAARSGKPVIPVGVCYGEKLKFRTKVVVKYGEPIYPQDYVDSQDEPNPRQLVKLKNAIWRRSSASWRALPRKRLPRRRPPMNKISVAKSAGFCFGVDRAVKMVYGELEKGTKVATLGPIIHNQDVVNDMKSKGARIIDSVDELAPDETVVIRSHGVGRDIYEQIEAKNCRMLDATCPFVSRIHKIVSEKSSEGYFILIAGDATHPEVQGIVGHCNQNHLVFKDNIELKDFFQKKYEKLKKKLAIVAQTTYNIVVWEKCLNAIPKNDPDIIIFDTICNATDTRQSDAAKLAQNSDIMLVVGGRHSSNTVKLFEVCSRFCKTYHIENADELRSLKLPAAEKIGITAGASTPAYIIKEVQTTMAENITATQDEEIDFAQALDESFKKIHTGEKVKGVVVGVDNAEITVDLGTKHTGYVKLEDLTDDPSQKPEDIVKVGDEIELIVIKVNDAEGTAQLSKKKVDEQAGYETVLKAQEEGAVLEGVVQHVVNKGVTLTYLGVRVFIPASQTGLPRGAELDELLKKKVEFTIIEVTEGKKRAVGSIKAVQNARKAEAQAKFWETAEVGQTFVGKVKSLTSFGAFVDLGGIDGMVHISELSWKRVKHPSEVVSVGDTLEVYIKDLNREENRISLGFKKAEDNPWEIFKANYNVGDVVKATIVSITSFGAFARIIDGVDGLIHISQIADKKVDNVKDILTVGDEVDVKIIDIDSESKRISISMRALIEGDGEDEAEEASSDVVYSDEAGIAPSEDAE